MLFFHLDREEITELVGRKTLAAKYKTNLLNQHVASLLEDMLSLLLQHVFLKPTNKTDLT